MPKYFKYRRVDIWTVEGLEQAERLLANGWRIISNGMFSVLLEKGAE